MKFNMLKPQRREAVFIAVLAIFTAVLFMLPTGFKNHIYDDSMQVKGRVVQTDNSLVRQYGIIKHGTQNLSVRVLEGRFKGQEYETVNQLMGKMELDKLFVPGDKILMTLDLDANHSYVLHAVALDYYRLNVEMILFGLFALLLVLFAGWTGLKSLMSFVVSVAVIWKLLIPGFLHGWMPPLPLALLLVLLLSAIIIFLVMGFTRKGLAAFMGAASGMFLTFLLSMVFGYFFKIHGAVKPFTETLLYSGFGHLDITSIFLASIVVASSGAMMDVAVDISASMEEVKQNAPGLSRRELTSSGLNVGRSVIGTMTTTLLLAYSGSFLSLMMFFMAQGLPVVSMMNLTYVSAEILTTLAGSFGLVTVAPFTALIGGLILGDNPRTAIAGSANPALKQNLPAMEEA